MDLSGKTIVLTGKFGDLSRAQAGAGLRALGALIGSSITKHTDAVFAGDDAGAKLTKAKALGIAVHGEAELRVILRGAAKKAPTTVAGPLERYVERFRAMVEELRAHPEVVVYRFNVNPAASRADFSAVEKQLGRPLPADIRAFYEQADGLLLQWTHKRHEHFDPKAHQPDDKRKSFLDYGPGCVRVLPIKEAFVTANWKNQFYDDTMGDKPGPYVLRGRSWPSLLDFSKSLRVFDWYSAFYVAAFVVHPDHEPWVIVGDDHGVCWDGYAPTNLESYLEGVLARYGTHSGREVFRDDSSRPALKERPRAWWAKRVVTLEKCLKQFDLVPPKVAEALTAPSSGLCDRLRSADAKERAKAAKEICFQLASYKLRDGSEYEKPLLLLLEDDVATVRRWATEAMCNVLTVKEPGQRNHGRALELMRKMSRDANREVRGAALGRFGTLIAHGLVKATDVVPGDEELVVAMKSYDFSYSSQAEDTFEAFAKLVPRGRARLENVGRKGN
jgi:hypothetical protein